MHFTPIFVLFAYKIFRILPMKIQVCNGKTCSERYSSYILKRIESDKQMFELDNLIVENCPCTGNCQKWPNVVIDGKVEHYMNPIKASKIIMNAQKQKKKKEKKFEFDESHNTWWNFRLQAKNEDAPEENFYVKEHINIIKPKSDDTADI